MEATYDKFIFRAGVELVTKSGIMLGLGETEKEVQQVLTDLREVVVTMITMDQYLAPLPPTSPGIPLIILF